MKIRTQLDTNFVFLLTLCSLNKIQVVVTSQDSYPSHHAIGLHNKHLITIEQFECYQRIWKHYNDTKYTVGPTCNMTWDGWLCWEETAPGVSDQNCPNYFTDFNPDALAYKVCTDKGEWGLSSERDKAWTDFTSCTANHTHHDTEPMTKYYLLLIGHGLSLVSLLISLGIFFHFKSLSCQRITLHKNLFFSFVLNSVITVTWFTVVKVNSGACRLLSFMQIYIMTCNYFWMLCEGIYLHTLIVVVVFAEKQRLLWYYLLGWGFPLLPASIYAGARLYYHNDLCWISSTTSLLYIIHGPICVALVLNFFFLMNIVRVLITKLRMTHQAESSLYMRAVRATLILIPLLGIQYVLLAYKPHDHWVTEIYLYINYICMHYQGLLVSTIFCFCNGEVQTVLRRHWNMQRLQFAGTFANAEIFRSASYVASSLTEVHRCHSIESHTEHMNGKSCPDIFRSESSLA